MPGILTEGCYNKHIDLATKSELIWGDYHLFEALQVITDTIEPRSDNTRARAQQMCV